MKAVQMHADDQVRSCTRWAHVTAAFALAACVAGVLAFGASSLATERALADDLPSSSAVALVAQDEGETASGTLDGGLTWELDASGALAISGSGDMPAWTSRNKVAWKDYRDQVKTIAIGDGVSSIADYAFSGLTGIESVSIPAAVTSIGEQAFAGCTSLASIEFPGRSHVESIDASAFSSCDALAKVNTTSKVAVQYFGSLADVEVPLLVYEDDKGETSVSYAFDASGAGVWILGRVETKSWPTIPDKIAGEPVVGIAAHAFEGDTALRGITLAAGSQIAQIEAHAFYGCSSLVEFIAPATLSAIDEGAFYGCSLLGSFTFASGSQLRSIGANAFRDCTALAAIDVPKPVSQIGARAFDGVNTVTFNNGSELEEVARNTFKGCTHVALGQGTKRLGTSAFLGCDTLESIDLPSSINVIADTAFSNCSSLQAVSIPSAVAELSAGVFNGCTSLVTVSLPVDTAIQRIGDSAFYGCSSLESFVIPEGVTSIGVNAFSGCRSLGELRIPAAVGSIGYRAFYNCASLASLQFADNALLQIIGGEAFKNCRALESVAVPRGVTSIDDEAFRGCSALALLTLPEDSQLATIGEKAFYNCGLLASVVLPETIASIGESAFEGCASLEDVQLKFKDAHLGKNCFMGLANPSSLYVVSEIMFSQLTENENFLNLDTTYVIVVGDNYYDLKNARLTVERAVFSGDEAKPIVSVEYDGVALVEGVDYNLVYEEAVDVGTYSLVVKGTRKKYVGFKRTSFDIVKSVVDIPVANEGLVYNATVQEGVKAHDAYKLSNATATNAGDYEAVASLADKDNCQWADGTVGDIVIPWSIARTAVVVTPHDANKVYGASDPRFTATVEGLPEGDRSRISYTLSREEGEDVGDYVISAVGEAVQGNFDVAFASATFTIASKDLSNATLRLEKASYVKTGQPIEPSVTVRLSGKTLERDVDYRVTYSNNVDVGTAAVAVEGIANYAGGISSTFAITTAAGEDNASTSPAASGSGQAAGSDGSKASLGKSTPASAMPIGMPIGASVSVAGVSYKVKSASTVVFKKAPKSKKKVVVPAKVRINGKSYKVVGIASKAFKGSKATTVVVKTKKLTKSSVKKCFTSSKVKTVKVPKAKKAAYKKIFKKKNSGRAVKVK